MRSASARRNHRKPLAVLAGLCLSLGAAATATAATAATTAALAGPRKAVPGKPTPPAPVRLTAVERAEYSALVRARRTGRPVVVGAETSPTVEVKAHPDGLLSMTSNVLPVRAKVHGVWRAINPALRRTASGIAPAVTTVPVTFSDGGTGPLVTVSNSAGQTASMYWPAALPRPRISGSVALYKNVLPGVDLRLQATGTGYQEALVVRTAAAAADPRLRSVTFTVKAGRGLVTRRGADRSLGLVDARTGKLIFVVTRPVMWDSSRFLTRVPVRYRLAGAATATIAMAPVPGKHVRYPLYIDPELAPHADYYAEVLKASNGFTENWNPPQTSLGNNQVQVGYCGYDQSYPHPCYWQTSSGTVLFYTNRVYFRFDTSDLEKQNGTTARIYFVSFDVEQIYNSDGCTARLTDLYSTTGGIDSSTNWGGPQGSRIGIESSNNGGGSGCQPGNLQFDSDDAGDGGLASTLEAAADNGAPNVTLELRADAENDKLQYKAFMDNPQLSIYYNFPPQAPTNLSVQDQVTCDPSTTYTSLTQPRLFATGIDNNPDSPLNLRLDYTLETSAGVAAGGSVAHSTGASGSQQSTTPSTPLAGGGAYQFQATATNEPVDNPPEGINVPGRSGPASAWYPFTVLTPPTVAPTISSFDYPPAQWGQPAGAPGVFTVATGGASNIAGFAYSFDGGTSSEPVPTTSDCNYLNDGGLGTSVDSNGDGGGSTSGELAVQGSTAQIEIPKNVTPGQHTLFVVSFDKAHNASGETAYTFYVAPNYQVTSQPATFINGSSLAAGATGANASLVTTQNNCCGISWRGGSQLIFNGNALNQTFTVTINVPDAGWWQIGADLTMAKDYGQAQVDLDQNINLGGTSAVPFDGYNPEVSLAYADLGTQHLTAGNHTLTFTMTGQNAASSGFKAGINYITLSPTSRYEGESLTHGAPSAGTLQVQANPPWSDNAELNLSNTVPGTKFTVNFNAPVESDYALGANLGTGPAYGELRLDLDPATTDINLGGTATTPFDAYSPKVSASYVFLGGVHLTAGQHQLQVTVTGTDPSSQFNRYNAGIDFLEVVPVTGATDASFTAAMNNLGIAPDGASSFAGNFDLTSSSTGKNLSLSALRDAGITPGTATGAGTTFTLNGATFTMPQLSANSGTATADNVIPDGQTVPLPSVKATDVALLAASTCGASPAMNATLNYSDGSSTQPLITSVPDWIKTYGAAQVVLDHWDVGTAASASVQPRLYEVLLPANPAVTLSSITLPVMPVNFLTNTHSCSIAANVLHILAIGTRKVSSGKAPAGAFTGGYAGPMDTAITPPGGSFGNTTLREVVATTTAGGASVRIQLSNAGAMVPVTFDAVTIGAQSSGEATVAAPVPVTFGGQASVTIPAGGDVTSDAVPMPSGGTGELVVSMHIPASSGPAPIHETQNARSFYAAGDQTANSDGTPFTMANSNVGLFYLARVDVSDSTATDGTVAVLGDQTAMAAPSGTFGYWASDLPSALASAGVALPGSVASVASSGLVPSHGWRMNGAGLDTATTAYDDGATPTANLTLNGTATFTTDDPGTGTTAGALSLDGTSGYASSSGQVINTAGSFTVSAWVRLSSLPSRDATVVAQDGNNASGFYLGVHAGNWAFYFANSDASTAAITGASGSAATAGTWTLLTGVYNAASNTAQLYVNGSLSASVTFTTWSATGNLTIGRDKSGDYLPGEVSDVRVFNRVVTATGVSETFNDGSNDTVTTANALSWLRNYVTAEPNPRDVIVAAGANDVLQGQSAPVIESNLRALVSAIQGYVVDNTSSPPTVQVILTTIVPLGLAAGDPREAVRRAVNSWITGNGSTAQVTSDVAHAVADPANPNNIAPSLLSGGAPTAQYYADIAGQIATDVSHAIGITL